MKESLFTFAAILGILINVVSCENRSKRLNNTEGMILVPAGEFIIGTNEVDKEHKAEAFGIPKPWFEDETPERKIYLKAFYIDKFEVTNEQYRKFIYATGYTPIPPDWENDTYSQGTANYPVTFVNFTDAENFAGWAGKRLPTEEEWEKAARGTDGRLYPWGNTFDISRANLSVSMVNVSEKMPVGLFKSGISPYGVYDMVGNVWEWTSSLYEPYKGNKYPPSEDYGGKYLVIRGMSYYYLGHFPDEMYSEVAAHAARASYREEVYPGTKTPDLGFRCIKYAAE